MVAYAVTPPRHWHWTTWMHMPRVATHWKTMWACHTLLGFQAQDKHAPLSAWILLGGKIQGSLCNSNTNTYWSDSVAWSEFSIWYVSPLAKRKASRSKMSRYKAWFEKGGSSKKGKKDDKPKRPQKGNKNRCKLCEELGHRVGSPKCRYTPEKTK